MNQSKLRVIKLHVANTKRRKTCAKRGFKAPGNVFEARENVCKAREDACEAQVQSAGKRVRTSYWFTDLLSYCFTLDSISSRFWARDPWFTHITALPKRLESRLDLLLIECKNSDARECKTANTFRHSVEKRSFGERVINKQASNRVVFNWVSK